MARKRALFGDVSKIRILLVAGLRMLAACVLQKSHVEKFGRYIFGDFAHNASVNSSCAHPPPGLTPGH